MSIGLICDACDEPAPDYCRDLDPSSYRLVLPLGWYDVGLELGGGARHERGELPGPRHARYTACGPVCARRLLNRRMRDLAERWPVEDPAA